MSVRIEITWTGSRVAGSIADAVALLQADMHAELGAGLTEPVVPPPALIGPPEPPTPESAAVEIDPTTGDEPSEGASHVCADCGQAFDSRFKLSGHRKAHRAKPAPPEPPRDTPGPVDMPLEDTYLCPDCGAVFAAPQGLSGHRRMTHLRTAAVCGDCGREFTSSASLGKHRVAAHPDPEPAVVLDDDELLVADDAAEVLEEPADDEDDGLVVDVTSGPSAATAAKPRKDDWPAPPPVRHLDGPNPAIAALSFICQCGHSRRAHHQGEECLVCFSCTQFRHQEAAG